MKKNNNRKNPKNEYLLTKKDYMRAWLFALHKRRRMAKAIKVGLEMTPESNLNIALCTELHAQK